MDSFLDFVPVPPEAKRYFERDWTTLDKSFKDNLTVFAAAIAPGNKHIELPTSEKVEIYQKPINLESPVKQEVASSFANVVEKSQEISAEKKEVATASVVYHDVSGAKEVPKTLQLTQPKEHDVPQPNDLEDIFGPTKTSLSSQPSPKVKDAFDFEEELEPIKVEAQAQESESSKSESKQTPTENPFTTGFDPLKFAEARKIADAVLADCRWNIIDLENLDKEHAIYAAETERDAYRVDAHKIADMMADVQAKKDRVNTIMIQLTSAKEGMQSAEDVYLSFGTFASSASSKEKREVQVKYHIKDFFIKLAAVERLHAMYEYVEKGLSKQFDTLSRLLSYHQMGSNTRIPNYEPDIPPSRNSLPDSGGIMESEKLAPIAVSMEEVKRSSKRDVDGLDDFRPTAVPKRNRVDGTQSVSF